MTGCTEKVLPVPAVDIGDGVLSWYDYDNVDSYEISINGGAQVNIGKPINEIAVGLGTVEKKIVYSMNYLDDGLYTVKVRSVKKGKSSDYTAALSIRIDNEINAPTIENVSSLNEKIYLDSTDKGEYEFEVNGTIVELGDAIEEGGNIISYDISGLERKVVNEIKARIVCGDKKSEYSIPVVFELGEATENENLLISFNNNILTTCTTNTYDYFVVAIDEEESNRIFTRNFGPTRYEYNVSNNIGGGTHSIKIKGVNLQLEKETNYSNEITININKLKTPNITISNEILSINNIDMLTSMDLYIYYNENIVVENTTTSGNLIRNKNGYELNLDDINIPEGEYAVKVAVKRIGHNDSDFSNIVNYTAVSNVELTIPTNVRFLNDYLTWNTVANASAYNVLVQASGPEVIYRTTYANSCYIDLSSNIDYKIKVQAVSGSKVSSPSQTVFAKKLSAPLAENVTYNESLASYEFSGTTGYAYEISRNGTPIADYSCTSGNPKYSIFNFNNGDIFQIKTKGNSNLNILTSDAYEFTITKIDGPIISYSGNSIYWTPIAGYTYYLRGINSEFEPINYKLTSGSDSYDILQYITANSLRLVAIDGNQNEASTNINIAANRMSNVSNISYNDTTKQLSWTYINSYLCTFEVGIRETGEQVPWQTFTVFNSTSLDLSSEAFLGENIDVRIKVIGINKLDSENLSRDDIATTANN